MILAKEQQIGASILFGIAIIAWIVMAIYPSTPPSPDQPKKKSWAERKDSIRLADSLRYVQWREEREQRYDSFRMADSMRHEAWKIERQQRWDSMRRADSLWRDSVGWHYVKRVKKDTILDLNHCDTTELLLLRGIGRFTASQIVRYREQLGGFYSPIQLTDEPLLQFHLDTLLHLFTADSSAIIPLDVNRCSTNALQRHPYLRFNQAKAIYSLRRERIRLHSLDDLRSLPELSDSDLLRLAHYLRFE